MGVSVRKRNVPLKWKKGEGKKNADRPGLNAGFLLKKKDTRLQLSHSFGATVSCRALSNPRLTSNSSTSQPAVTSQLHPALIEFQSFQSKHCLSFFHHHTNTITSPSMQNRLENFHVCQWNKARLNSIISLHASKVWPKTNLWPTFTATPRNDRMKKKQKKRVKADSSGMAVIKRETKCLNEPEIQKRNTLYQALFYSDYITYLFLPRMASATLLVRRVL